MEKKKSEYTFFYNFKNFKYNTQGYLLQKKGKEMRKFLH